MTRSPQEREASGDQHETQQKQGAGGVSSEMKYVFGPVPSRRLGRSLGIDTIPLKTCNWNCVYCQLGRTVPLTNEQREYYPRNDILTQVKEALARHSPGEIDWVTFVGSGEPTLHSGLGWLISRVKETTDLPLAVISNGSLLYLPKVRQALSLADVVMPSLDAGSADLYRQINRPHPEATFERLVEGLIAFRQAYQGKLWVEVMLVRGLNDGQKALQDIAKALGRIQPDEVHINLPTRPPAETWVQSPDEEGLMRARAIIGDIAEVVHPVEGTFELGGNESVVEAIMGIITRHPMCHEELERALTRWAPETITETLAELAASGQAQVVERFGTRFWSALAARYPDENHSLTSAPGRRHRRRPAEKKDAENEHKQSGG
jgi:wyosine [tRNA(Phe)-imidazoG37] synthetase (radical SAM superfamily)